MKECTLAVRCDSVAEALALAAKLMRDPAVVGVELSHRPPEWCLDADLAPPVFTALRPEPR
jgi:hypothetical protein